MEIFLKNVVTKRFRVPSTSILFLSIKLKSDGFCAPLTSIVFFWPNYGRQMVLSPIDVRSIFLSIQWNSNVFGSHWLYFCPCLGNQTILCPIDFHSIFWPYYESHWDPKLFQVWNQLPHSSKYHLVLNRTKKCYRFRTIWGRVNDDIHFWVDYTFKFFAPKYISVTMFCNHLFTLRVTCICSKINSMLQIQFMDIKINIFCSVP